MTDVQSLTKGLAALGAMTLVGAAGQGCDESELEPRTPAAVVIAQPRGKPLWIPEELPERAVEDELWILTGRVTRPSDLPPPEHVMLAHTKSLGFIGDNPIGDWASPPPPTRSTTATLRDQRPGRSTTVRPVTRRPAR
jgi:hypothetical protein